MSDSCISTERIISKLDEHLHKNDYVSAECHLLYWLDEATRADDGRIQLLLHNELMGLYRKLGRRDEALIHAQQALDTVERLGASRQVGGATAYLNAATVYKAFGMADASLPLFESALQIYESDLDANDSRLAGLYNNMALTLVDLKDFDRADELYKKAISIMLNSCDGAPEAAITYLNMANAAEARLGLVDAEELITQYVSRAKALLEEYEKRGGNYAFVCEKCSSVFDYYGYFIYASELRERSRRIYEGT
ncbi:MAG: tetratricopeptide repeat protein [Clostridia bacterium]|nr:tetratricopeptide repeat protein [Clostridia bacterium]